jgi:hypothetical protein
MRIRARGLTLAAVAVAGLKVRHYNFAVERGWPTWRGVRHWRPAAKVKEYKDDRSLERLVDMESPERRIRFGIFGESRGGEAHY